MIKLFATVLAVSDTGSIAMTSDITDFPDPPSCARAVERIYKAPRQSASIAGHIVEIKISAECVPVLRMFP